jgi:O-antigen ligase
MYRRFVRALAAGLLLFSFWPSFRFHSLTIFDWAAPVVVIAALLYRSRERSVSLFAFRYPLLGIFLLLCGGYLSIILSSDTTEHVHRVAVLLLALCAMAALAYGLASRNIFSLTEVLTLLCVSGAVSSTVCILQGQFGMLTNLAPPGELEDWSRMTGLTEHPIEAGIISAYSAVIATGLAIHTKHRSLPYILLAAIDIYSMKYSASLTAAFAMVVGILALSIFSRSFYLAIALVVVACVVGAVALPAGLLGPFLSQRLEAFTIQRGNYLTLQYRETQWAKALELIDARTLLLGNGYSTADLPERMDIHNGFLAAVFHFGVLGLISQFLLIWFFVSRLFGDGPRALRGILIGCIVIFASGYLTGPPFARRSIWVPMILIAAFLPERCAAGRYGELRGPITHST